VGIRAVPGLFVLGLCAGIACRGEPATSSDGPGRDAPAVEASTDGARSAAGAIVLVGDGGDTVRLPGPARRIVSLVPSATETLVRLGAADRLVGRTEYDTASALSQLPSVGGGLQPNLEILRTLEPDVVVGFAGESDARTARTLDDLGIPVLQVRPDGIPDVRRMILRMGELVAAEGPARALVAEIDGTLEEIRAAVGAYAPVRAVYLLGGTPPLAAGPGTFLSQLVEVGGGVNVLDDLGALYAPVSPEVLLDRDIDAVLMTRGSRVDGRILEGRRVVELPGGVEIPGPDVGASAWIVARALHPELPDRGR
jgi:iron complex transport system substrate-binding protein